MRRLTAPIDTIPTEGRIVKAHLREVPLGPADGLRERTLSLRIAHQRSAIFSTRRNLDISGAALGNCGS
jgi:hypothetical protein